MIEATDPIQTTQQASLPLGPDTSTPAEARKSAQSDSGTAQVHVAERQKEVPAPGPSFEVKLDDKTLCLYSELRDPITGAVLMRIPDSYPGGQKSDGSGAQAGSVEQIA